MAVILTAKERAHLKAVAHSLEPVVFIGHGGVTDAVVAEVERALTAHGLIKIKAGAADRDARVEIYDTLCQRTDAAKVQSVGKVMVLWRPTPDEPPAKAPRPVDPPA
ncbi:MAG: ribosome assembly RNA-binding protein YhbY [Acidobacteriota bacterium]